MMSRDASCDQTFVLSPTKVVRYQETMSDSTIAACKTIARRSHDTGTCRNAVPASGDTAGATTMTSRHARQVMAFLPHATVKLAMLVG